MLLLDSRDMLEAIMLIVHHVGQVVAVVVPVPSVVLVIVVHQTLVMVEQVLIHNVLKILILKDRFICTLSALIWGMLKY